MSRVRPARTNARLRAARMGGCLLLLAAASVLGGCMVATFPRFPADVAASVAHTPMRRLETPELVVYYPQGRGPEAERLAAQVGGCVGALQSRARIHNRFSRRKPFLVLPEQPFNDGFVLHPALGHETASVVTRAITLETWTEMGEAPDPALFACHEMAHWVQIMQIAGFWGLVDTLFGDILTPQTGLDRWFLEGLATFYETRLGGTGRMTAPFWDGAFAAAVAGRHLDGGDLSHAQRGFAMGNEYLVGSRFVEFLVERHGERKLWELVEKQGRSFFFPLGVNLRFWQVYDQTLSSLIDAFADEMARRYPARRRPPGQKRVRQLGHTVRYAVARNGTEAIVGASFDQPLRLKVFAPDGRRLRSRALQEVLPPRTIVDASARRVSGLSLTADGRVVFFAIQDRGPVFLRQVLVRYDVDQDQMHILDDHLEGPAGGFTEDGKTLFFTRAAGDRHDLAELDLATGARRILVPGVAGAFFVGPRPSPDGTRVVAIRVERNVGRLVLVDRRSGTVTQAGAVTAHPTEPWFLDDRRILFVDQRDGRYQVHLHDLATGITSAVTDAPYLALAPRPAPGGRIRFLNREDWSFTLDEVVLPSAPPPPDPIVSNSVPGGASTAKGPTANSGAPEPASAGGTASAAGAPAAVILSDRPYRSIERLLVPQLHGFTLVSLPASEELLLGAVLGGGDRLGLHRWSVGGFVDTLADRPLRGGAMAAYLNRQLAPVTVRVAGLWLSVWDRPFGDPRAPRTVDREQRELTLGAVLPFFTHRAELALHTTDERRIGDPNAPARRLFSGATASLGLSTVESTPYTGPRRALGLDLAASTYPRALGTQPFTFHDLRAALLLRAPVPPSARLGLSLGLRGRALPGTPAGDRRLELGGVASLLELYRRKQLPEPPLAPPPSPAPPAPAPPSAPFLPLLPTRFAESLRGYEDRAFAVRRALLADVRLRYPVIIDQGFASTLWVLPALFVRELEVELFAAGAWNAESTARTAFHAATGAALALHTLFGDGALVLRYQISKRLLDDGALVHLVGLAF